MKILFLAHLFPLPLDSGGKIKTYGMLRSLAREHDVTVLAYTRTEDERRHIPDLQRLCRAVHTLPLERGPLARTADPLRSLMLGRSFIITRDFRREMLEKFESLVAALEPDAVHIDHLQMAQFIRFDASYRTVLDQHNVESTIIRRVAETAADLPTRIYSRIEWPKLRRYELEVCRECDVTLTVSEQDRAALMELDPGITNIHSLPIGIDVDSIRPVERNPVARNILFLGTMYWPPNVDSVLYFYRQIMPSIRREIPECVFTIAGQRPARSIRALAADPAVRVTGYVSDVRDSAQDCGVFIVPLRSGSGVRVKILNAMAMALPVVSTSVGAEGLEVTSGKHLLIADTPQDFARSVTEILSDSDLAQRLGQSARELVCEEYSWDVAGKRLLDIYRNLPT